jgi:hypothetical protein
MLRRILALLASGGARRLEDLALDLGVDRAEVEDMLRQLCSLGYIEELTAALAGSCRDGEKKSCAGCSGCGMASFCGQTPKSRVWALTPKGKKKRPQIAPGP